METPAAAAKFQWRLVSETYAIQWADEKAQYGVNFRPAPQAPRSNDKAVQS